MLYIGFLISSLPFMLPFRDYPNGDFYSDASALFVALLGVVFLFKRFSFGRDVLLIVGVAFLFLVSGWIVRGYYYDVWLLSGVSLLIAAAFFSGVVSCSLVEKERFFNGCVYGLVVGGGFSVVVGVFQAFGVVELLGGIVFSGGNGVYGNIGQRNMYSTYVFFFVGALSWLAVRRKVNIWLSVFILSVAAYVLAFAGSRMVLLDSLVLVLLVGWFYFCSEDKYKDERGWFSILILSFVILLMFFQIFLFFLGEGGAARVTLSVDAPRMGEWLKAWQIFLDNPFGVGVGQYAKYSFIYQLEASAASQITWTNAHNIFFQFLVEFGVWGLPFFAFGAWLVWSFAVRCLSAGPKGLMVLSCVSVMLVHSFLEYPLWYMSFLFIFVSMIAVFGCESLAKPFPLINISALLVGLILLYCGGLYMSMPAYRFPVRDISVNVERLAKLLDYSVNPVLAWPADKLLTEYLLEDDGPELDFKLCKSIHVAVREPLYPYLERIALLAIAGQDFDLASRVLKSRYAVYPDMPDSYLKARIGLLWPNYAHDFIDKIDAGRAAGFPDYDYYRLSVPERCQ